MSGVREGRGTAAIRGRGTALKPPGRFAREHREPEDGDTDAPESSPATQFYTEDSRRIVSRNASPDVPFDQSINPYRGCEHGCIYCYARPSHAYVDLSPGLDFEQKIFVKPNAPQLLRQELSRPGYRCSPITLGANTDAWQPAERRFQVTRQILEVLRDFRHPVSVITKSALIERDIDILTELAAQRLVMVLVSVTTLDDELKRRLEPRTAGGRRRIEVIRRLSAAGIPCGVMAAPMIPGLNDQELESILEAAAAAGAGWAGWVLLRLPHEVRGLFVEWLRTHYPLRAEKVMSLLRQARGGRDSDSRFGRRMRGEGVYAGLLDRRFRAAARRHGLSRPYGQLLDCSAFRPPATGRQLDLLG